MRNIEEWLCSEESGEAFSHCVRCRLPLLELACPWLVNKEFQRGECVMEYAICQSCRDEVSSGFSAASMKSVREFLETQIDWEERVKEFMLAADLGSRFDFCISCRTGRGDCRGFGISALFDEGGEITTGPLPLLICSPCIGRMTAGLSEESRDVWRKFLAEHFAGPPGDSEQWPGSGFPGLM